MRLSLFSFAFIRGKRQREARLFPEDCACELDPVNGALAIDCPRWWGNGLLWALGCFATVGALPLPAVIFYSTADPNFNTIMPTGTLAGSGWQWVGKWGGFQGTPIGPHHFLTARHVGGVVGEPLVLDGTIYPTTAFFDDPESDLRIWQVAGTFPTWAPLYRASDEVGKRLVVFGRGLTRGAEVHDEITHSLRGWLWGAGDGKLRWGQNTLVSVVNGGPPWGALLYARFDGSDGVNEAHLAVGDSSGPVFLNDGFGWKLAGIAAVVDAHFSTTGGADAGFNAAIFDVRGLYYGSAGKWKLVSGPAPVRSGFYSTRVSGHLPWIDRVLSSALAPHLPAVAPPLGASPAPTSGGNERGVVAGRRHPL